jgi:hypothetical protein
MELDVYKLQNTMVYKTIKFVAIKHHEVFNTIVFFEDHGIVSKM